MADTKQWAAQVEEAFRSAVLNNIDDDAAQFSALKMSALELMAAAHQEGLREADQLREKRQLLATLLSSDRVGDQRAFVGMAMDMVDHIFATVR
jgi:hypothetical protein